MVGSVVRNSMNKTAVVQVERIVKHPRYGKYIRRRSKYFAHDEKGACNIGDKVMIISSHPISRLKRWRVSKVLGRAR